MWLALVDAAAPVLCSRRALWDATAVRVSGLKVPRKSSGWRGAWLLPAIPVSRGTRSTWRGLGGGRHGDQPTLPELEWRTGYASGGCRGSSIAHVLGYSEKGSGAEARKAAALYRERLANGGTLPKARLAYKRRERGESWARIARRVGYAEGRSARVMARRYAERAGEPWPVPLSDAPA